MESKKYSINDFLEARASGAASFSPDGRQVCYLNTDTGTSQIYLLDIESGMSTQLTHYDDSISRVVFSPTKNLILFEMSTGGNENSQLFFIDLTKRETIPLTETPEYRYNFGAWSDDGEYIAFRSNERNGIDFDVYVMHVETKERRCIYADGGMVSAVSFSPKNTFLAISKQYSLVHTDLYLFNLLTSTIECITTHEKEEIQGIPRWLPDESVFFVTMDRDREFMGLAKYDLATKSFAYVLTPEWDIDGIAVDREGKYLALTINEDGRDRVRMYNANTLKELPLKMPSNGLVQALRFSNDGTKLIFTFTDSTRTQDIWLYDIESHALHQLTHSHQAVPAEVLVEPELIHFVSFDGLSIPAFIYTPKNIEAGKKMRVIIDIHGGPESQYRPALVRLTQYFVHNGYAVIAPNVRGSSGYGKTYLTLDNIEKRLDSVKDLVALHTYIQSVPEFDSTKVVLSGGSYGGFMVLAGLAFHPDLWAAGVDIVGIANFVTFLENTAPYRRGLREAEYGSLENDRELLERISPINSVENILAPLVVIHGANDPRVPLSEAEQIVEELRKRNREVEFMVYPDEGHGLAKLKNRLDAYPKVVAFLERVLSD